MTESKKTEAPEQSTPVADSPAGPVIGQPTSARTRKRKVAADAPATVRKPVEAAQNFTVPEDADLESVERLIEQADEFFPDIPAPRASAAGAFHALAHHGIHELTREQARSVIDAWLQSETQIVEDN